MRCKLCGETSNGYDLCDLCWIKFKGDVIDARWKFVQRGIQDYHIVNGMVVVIIILYFIGLLGGKLLLFLLF